MSAAAENLETSQPTTPPEDFSIHVQKSKEAIAAENDVVQKKRGRGRPPKARDGQGNIKRDETPSNSPKNESSANVNEIDVTPMLSQVLKIPFALAAEKTNYEGFHLTDDEAKQPAGALNDVLKLYLPDLEKMDPKTMSLLVFGMSVGSIALVKFTAYQSHKNQLKLESQNNRETARVERATAEPPPVPTHNAAKIVPASGNDTDRPPARELKPEDYFSTHRSPFSESN